MVTRYELREDEDGAGRNRGGIATIRETEFVQGGRVSIEGDGNKYPPWGFEGGDEGTPGAVILNAKTKEECSV